MHIPEMILLNSQMTFLTFRSKRKEGKCVWGGCSVCYLQTRKCVAGGTHTIYSYLPTIYHLKLNKAATTNKGHLGAFQIKIDMEWILLGLGETYSNIYLV